MEEEKIAAKDKSASASSPRGERSGSPSGQIEDDRCGMGPKGAAKEEPQGEPKGKLTEM